MGWSTHGLDWAGSRFLNFGGLGWVGSWVRNGRSPKIKNFLNSLNLSTQMAMGLIGLWVGFGLGFKFSPWYMLGWVGWVIWWVGLS